MVTGSTQFADDLSVPGMLFGKVRWADHPYARIVSVDTAEAEAVPGVIAVLTARDVPGQNAFGRVIADQPALAADVVRFIGDAVACAFAETAEAAEAACALVRVTYEPHARGLLAPGSGAARCTPPAPQR